jgi:hypothetical protein
LVEAVVIPTPWHEVPPNARVLLGSGRIVHVIATVPLQDGAVLVRMRDDNGRTRDVVIDDSIAAPAVVLAEPEDLIPIMLSARFPNVEFLRSL